MSQSTWLPVCGSSTPRGAESAAPSLARRDDATLPHGGGVRERREESVGKVGAADRTHACHWPIDDAVVIGPRTVIEKRGVDDGPVDVGALEEPLAGGLVPDDAAHPKADDLREERSGLK